MINRSPFASSRARRLTRGRPPAGTEAARIEKSVFACGRLTGQPLGLEPFAIGVKRLLRFLMVAHSLFGLEAARRYALDLRDQAHAALARSGLGQAAYLACLADKIVERDN